MEGYRKILVPLDGSKISETILPVIEKVGAAFKDTIYLLKVVYIDPVLCWIYARRANRTKEELQASAMQQAEEYLREIEEQLKAKGFKVESSVRYGDAAQQISEYAREEDIGLIAMSTHARNGVKRWLVGSVAEEVLRHVTKPIFLLRCDGEQVQAGQRLKDVS